MQGCVEAVHALLSHCMGNMGPTAELFELFVTAYDAQDNLILPT